MEEMRGLGVDEKELSQAQLGVSHTETHRHVHNT